MNFEIDTLRKMASSFLLHFVLAAYTIPLEDVAPSVFSSVRCLLIFVVFLRQTSAYGDARLISILLACALQTAFGT